MIQHYSSYALNLRRLVIFRALFIVGALCTVLGARYALGVSLPMGGLVSVIVGFTLFNAFTGLRLRHTRAVTAVELFGQLLADVVTLSVLLYLTQGASNPFAALLLVPLTMTATALPANFAWAMAVIIVTLYSLLTELHLPLPPGHHDNFTLHVLGMWFNFVVSAGLIAFFVVKMGNTVRERDHALAEAREKRMRDEQLVALGTLAAGAAHELGTPLATIAVLAREIEPENSRDPELSTQLRILREQVARCKTVLSTMAANAGQMRAEAGRGCTLDAYLTEIVDQWKSDRHGVMIYSTLQGTRPVPTILADQSLTQAIVNILNNAADASKHRVDLYGSWSDSELRIEICDYGDGFSAETAARAGDLLYTTKGEGMGLGLFLANATLSRLGGELELFNRDGCGACARVTLPLANLLTVT